MSTLHWTDIEQAKKDLLANSDIPWVTDIVAVIESETCHQCKPYLTLSISKNGTLDINIEHDDDCSFGHRGARMVQLTRGKQ